MASYLCLQLLLWSDLFSEPASSTPVVQRVNDLSYTTLGISLGYFMTDALMMFKHPSIGNTEMYVHHAVGVVSLIVAMQLHQAHVYVLLLLMSEMTTPCVNLRWYLDKMGLKSSQLYTINGLLLLLIWGIVRVLLFVPFYAHVYQNWVLISQIPQHAVAILLGVPLVLFALNTMWFVKIVKGAYKLVFAGKHSANSSNASNNSLRKQSSQTAVQLQARSSSSSRLHAS